MIVQSPAVLGGQPVVEVVSLDVREESIGDCFVVHFPSAMNVLAQEGGSSADRPAA